MNLDKENQEYVGQLIKTFNFNKFIRAKLDCHKETGNNCYNWYVPTNTEDLNEEPKADNKKYESEPEDEREVDFNALSYEQQKRKIIEENNYNDDDFDDDDGDD